MNKLLDYKYLPSVLGFIKTETFADILASVSVKMVSIKSENGHQLVFFSPKLEIIRQEKKVEEPIFINDVDGIKLDKKDVYIHQAASGQIEFNFKDLTLLNPSGWLNDKIVDWYGYRLFLSLSAEKYV